MRADLAVFQSASNHAAFKTALRITSEDVGAEERGHARTRARARAAREALDATNLFGSAAAGPAGGGIQRVRPAARTMAVVRMPGLDQLALAHFQFETLDANAKDEFLKARRSFKPMTGIPPFVQGPGTIGSFATVYEILLKLADRMVHHIQGEKACDETDSEQGLRSTAKGAARCSPFLHRSKTVY